MSNFAPVIVTTLNRFIHFKQCIGSLASCPQAIETELYVFFDYPLKEVHWKGYHEINNYLPKIEGFKEVNIIKRERNYGPYKNTFDSINIVLEKHDRLIYTEDDNIFSPSFLKYINSGLNTYSDRSDIFAITGYNDPIIMPKWYLNDVYLRKGFAAWGVGIYRDKWLSIDWSIENLELMLSKQNNLKEIKKYHLRNIDQLISIKKTGLITADGFIKLNLIDKDMYTVYPVFSLVRNIGHDGTGVHCQINPKYLNQPIDSSNKEIIFPKNLQVNRKLETYVYKTNDFSLLDRLKYYFRYFKNLLKN